MSDALCRDVVAAARAALGDELVGVYAVGSLALGGFDPARSDVDLAVVTTAGGARLRALARALDGVELPVRRLEVVAYRPGAGCDFALNYNRDRDAAATVDLDPAAVPRFWFVIDRAIAHAHGVALHGPPPATVIPAPPAAEVGAALADALAWYRTAGDPVALRIAAARAEHHARTGAWASKADAARWAGLR